MGYVQRVEDIWIFGVGRISVRGSELYDMIDEGKEVTGEEFLVVEN